MKKSGIYNHLCLSDVDEIKKPMNSLAIAIEDAIIRDIEKSITACVVPSSSAENSFSFVVAPLGDDQPYEWNFDFRETVLRMSAVFDGDAAEMATELRAIANILDKR